MQIVIKIIVVIILCLYPVDGFNQDKKHLTDKDYYRWNYFYKSKVSPNAKWINYIVHNQNGSDTMVLRKIENSLKYTIPGGKQGSFSPSSDQFAYIRDNVLVYQHLGSGKRDSIDGIDNYLFSKGGEFILAQGKREAKELYIINPVTNQIKILPSVKEYVLSPDSTKIALMLQKGNYTTVSVVSLDKYLKEYEIIESQDKLSGLTWNTHGNGLAFFEQLPQQKNNRLQHEVQYITFRLKELQVIKNKMNAAQLPSEHFIPISRLFFSSDDKQLFFDVLPILEKEKEVEDAIIWSSSAEILPPPKKNQPEILMCWHIKANQFVLVNNPDESVAIPTASGKHALIVTTSSYLPFFEYGGIYADLYIKDLQTGHQKLIAKKISHQKNHIVISPQGKYITWFANENWWLYDIEKNKTRCLTCGIQANFEDMLHDYPGDKYPNAKPFWTKNDGAIILADYNDVWLFTPDGKTKKQITNGKSIKSMFRVYDEGYFPTVRGNFLMYITRSFDASKGIILKEVNTQTLEEGISCYYPTKPLKRIILTDDQVNSIVKVGDVFKYTLSDFDKSPELVIHHENQKEGVVILRSNEHQKEYHWGRSKMIYYTVNDVPLKGALFYPADYQPTKVYPMIVKVYQKGSSELRKYVPPTLANSIGYNITNLTAAGYFVLCPDIHFTLNKTGESALKCIMSSVDKAIETANIDKENIGLFGHSFGGFEVSYIISQTNRFKAAISGSGWHDLVGTYLGTDDFSISSMWRFETQQLRLTAPFYSADFAINSPIMQAHTIQTPLLLWAGSEDSRVLWDNSSKMQMALWRLGKKSIFLVYPNEQHFLSQMKNQLDLSSKTLDWYDYYLKGKERAGWMN